MARLAFPVALLVALVGGYVVGQQPGTLVAQGTRGEVEPSNPVADVPPPQAETPEQHQPLPVGRFVPADGGRMLDTTDGTLYVQRDRDWVVAARIVGICTVGDETEEGSGYGKRPAYYLNRDR